MPGKLICLGKDGEEKKLGVFPISSLHVFIGSDAYCDLRIKHQDISPQHCLITTQKDKPALIRNLSRTSPTLLNGVEIGTKDVELKDEDIIIIHHKQFKWRYDEIPTGGASRFELESKARKSWPHFKDKLVAVVPPQRRDEDLGTTEKVPLRAMVGQAVAGGTRKRRATLAGVNLGTRTKRVSVRLLSIKSGVRGARRSSVADRSAPLRLSSSTATLVVNSGTPLRLDSRKSVKFMDSVFQKRLGQRTRENYGPPTPYRPSNTPAKPKDSVYFTPPSTFGSGRKPVKSILKTPGSSSVKTQTTAVAPRLVQLASTPPALDQSQPSTSTSRVEGDDGLHTPPCEEDQLEIVMRSSKKSSSKVASPPSTPKSATKKRSRFDESLEASELAAKKLKEEPPRAIDKKKMAALLQCHRKSLTPHPLVKGRRRVFVPVENVPEPAPKTKSPGARKSVSLEKTSRSATKPKSPAARRLLSPEKPSHSTTTPKSPGARRSTSLEKPSPQPEAKAKSPVARRSQSLEKPSHTPAKAKSPISRKSASQEKVPNSGAKSKSPGPKRPQPLGPRRSEPLRSSPVAVKSLKFSSVGKISSVKALAVKKKKKPPFRPINLERKYSLPRSSVAKMTSTPSPPARKMTRALRAANSRQPRVKAEATDVLSALDLSRKLPTSSNSSLMAKKTSSPIADFTNVSGIKKLFSPDKTLDVRELFLEESCEKSPSRAGDEGNSSTESPSRQSRRSSLLKGRGSVITGKSMCSFNIEGVHELPASPVTSISVSPMNTSSTSRRSLSLKAAKRNSSGSNEFSSIKFQNDSSSACSPKSVDGNKYSPMSVKNSSVSSENNQGEFINPSISSPVRKRGRPSKHESPKSTAADNPATPSSSSKNISSTEQLTPVSDYSELSLGSFNSSRYRNRSSSSLSISPAFTMSPSTSKFDTNSPQQESPKSRKTPRVSLRRIVLKGNTPKRLSKSLRLLNEESELGTDENVGKRLNSPAISTEDSVKNSSVRSRGSKSSSGSPHLSKSISKLSWKKKDLVDPSSSSVSLIVHASDSVNSSVTDDSQSSNLSKTPRSASFSSLQPSTQKVVFASTGKINKSRKLTKNESNRKGLSPAITKRTRSSSKININLFNLEDSLPLCLPSSTPFKSKNAKNKSSDAIAQVDKSGHTVVHLDNSDLQKEKSSRKSSSVNVSLSKLDNLVSTPEQSKTASAKSSLKSYNQTPRESSIKSTRSKSSLSVDLFNLDKSASISNNTNLNKTYELSKSMRGNVEVLHTSATSLSMKADSSHKSRKQMSKLISNQSLANDSLTRYNDTIDLFQFEGNLPTSTPAKRDTSQISSHLSISRHDSTVKKLNHSGVDILLETTKKSTRSNASVHMNLFDLDKTNSPRGKSLIQNKRNSEEIRSKSMTNLSKHNLSATSQKLVKKPTRSSSVIEVHHFKLDSSQEDSKHAANNLNRSMKKNNAFISGIDNSSVLSQEGSARRGRKSKKDQTIEPSLLKPTRSSSAVDIDLFKLDSTQRESQRTPSPTKVDKSVRASITNKSNVSIFSSNDISMLSQAGSAMRGRKSRKDQTIEPSLLKPTRSSSAVDIDLFKLDSTQRESQRTPSPTKVDKSVRASITNKSNVSIFSSNDISMLSQAGSAMRGRKSRKDQTIEPSPLKPTRSSSAVDIDLFKLDSTQRESQRTPSPAKVDKSVRASIANKSNVSISSPNDISMLSPVGSARRGRKSRKDQTIEPSPLKPTRSSSAVDIDLFKLDSTQGESKRTSSPTKSVRASITNKSNVSISSPNDISMLSPVGSARRGRQSRKDQTIEPSPLKPTRSSSAVDIDLFKLDSTQRESQRTPSPAKVDKSVRASIANKSNVSISSPNDISMLSPVGSARRGRQSRKDQTIEPSPLKPTRSSSAVDIDLFKLDSTQLKAKRTPSPTKVDKSVRASITNKTNVSISGPNDISMLSQEGSAKRGRQSRKDQTIEPSPLKPTRSSSAVDNDLFQLDSTQGESKRTPSPTKVDKSVRASFTNKSNVSISSPNDISMLSPVGSARRGRQSRKDQTIEPSPLKPTRSSSAVDIDLFKLDSTQLKAKRTPSPTKVDKSVRASFTNKSNVSISSPNDISMLSQAGSARRGRQSRKDQTIEPSPLKPTRSSSAVDIDLFKLDSTQLKAKRTPSPTKVDKSVRASIANKSNVSISGPNDISMLSQEVSAMRGRQSRKDQTIEPSPLKPTRSSSAVDIDLFKLDSTQLKAKRTPSPTKVDKSVRASITNKTNVSISGPNDISMMSQEGSAKRGRQSRKDQTSEPSPLKPTRSSSAVDNDLFQLDSTQGESKRTPSITKVYKSVRASITNMSNVSIFSSNDISMLSQAGSAMRGRKSRKDQTIEPSPLKPTRSSSAVDIDLFKLDSTQGESKRTPSPTKSVRASITNKSNVSISSSNDISMLSQAGSARRGRKSKKDQTIEPSPLKPTRSSSAVDIDLFKLDSTQGESKRTSSPTKSVRASITNKSNVSISSPNDISMLSPVGSARRGRKSRKDQTIEPSPLKPTRSSSAVDIDLFKLDSTQLKAKRTPSPTKVDKSVRASITNESNVSISGPNDISMFSQEGSGRRGRQSRKDQTIEPSPLKPTRSLSAVDIDLFKLDSTQGELKRTHSPIKDNKSGRASITNKSKVSISSPNDLSMLSQEGSARKGRPSRRDQTIEPSTLKPTRSSSAANIDLLKLDSSQGKSERTLSPSKAGKSTRASLGNKSNDSIYAHSLVSPEATARQGRPSRKDQTIDQSPVKSTRSSSAVDINLFKLDSSQGTSKRTPSPTKAEKSVRTSMLSPETPARRGKPGMRDRIVESTPVKPTRSSSAIDIDLFKLDSSQWSSKRIPSPTKNVRASFVKKSDAFISGAGDKSMLSPEETARRGKPSKRNNVDTDIVSFSRSSKSPRYSDNKNIKLSHSNLDNPKHTLTPMSAEFSSLNLSQRLQLRSLKSEYSDDISVHSTVATPSPSVGQTVLSPKSRGSLRRKGIGEVGRTPEINIVNVKTPSSVLSPRVGESSVKEETTTNIDVKQTQFITPVYENSRRSHVGGPRSSSSQTQSEFQISSTTVGSEISGEIVSPLKNMPQTVNKSSVTMLNKNETKLVGRGIRNKRNLKNGIDIAHSNDVSSGGVLEKVDAPKEITKQRGRPRKRNLPSPEPQISAKSSIKNTQHSSPTPPKKSKMKDLPLITDNDEGMKKPLSRKTRKNVVSSNLPLQVSTVGSSSPQRKTRSEQVKKTESTKTIRQEKQSDIDIRSSSSPQMKTRKGAVKQIEPKKSRKQEKQAIINIGASSPQRKTRSEQVKKTEATKSLRNVMQSDFDIGGSSSSPPRKTRDGAVRQTESRKPRKQEKQSDINIGVSSSPQRKTRNRTVKQTEPQRSTKQEKQSDIKIGSPSPQKKTRSQQVKKAETKSLRQDKVSDINVGSTSPQRKTRNGAVKQTESVRSRREEKKADVRPSSPKRKTRNGLVKQTVSTREEKASDKKINIKSKQMEKVASNKIEIVNKKVTRSKVEAAPNHSISSESSSSSSTKRKVIALKVPSKKQKVVSSAIMKLPSPKLRRTRANPQLTSPPAPSNTIDSDNIKKRGRKPNSLRNVSPSIVKVVSPVKVLPLDIVNSKKSSRRAKLTDSVNKEIPQKQQKRKIVVAEEAASVKATKRNTKSPNKQNSNTKPVKAVVATKAKKGPKPSAVKQVPEGKTLLRRGRNADTVKVPSPVKLAVPVPKRGRPAASNSPVNAKLLKNKQMNNACTSKATIDTKAKKAANALLKPSEAEVTQAVLKRGRRPNIVKERSPAKSPAAKRGRPAAVAPAAKSRQLKSKPSVESPEVKKNINLKKVMKAGKSKAAPQLKQLGKLPATTLRELVRENSQVKLLSRRGKKEGDKNRKK